MCFRIRPYRRSSLSAMRNSAAAVPTIALTDPDLQGYQPSDHAGPYLQLGEDWRRAASAGGASIDTAEVSDVTITRNTFDKPEVAVGGGGLPIKRLFMTYNIFGAYHAALE